MFTVTRLPTLTDGSPVSGAIRFAAADGGRELASGELLTWSHLGDETGRIDVRNSPMLAAIARNGHGADVRPWYKWMYRRVAG